MRVRFGGFGGQGILVAGHLIGLAAVHDGLNAVQSQQYTSEARGGMCSSDVTVAKGEILEVELEEVDLLACMSQRALDALIDTLVPGGVLVIDSELVKAKVGERDLHLHAEPFTGIAKREVNRGIAGNIVLLGYLTAVMDIVSEAGMREAIRTQMPKGTGELSILAFESGLMLGQARRAERVA